MTKFALAVSMLIRIVWINFFRCLQACADINQIFISSFCELDRVGDSKSELVIYFEEPKVTNQRFSQRERKPSESEPLFAGGGGGCYKNSSTNIVLSKIQKNEFLFHIRFSKTEQM